MAKAYDFALVNALVAQRRKDWRRLSPELFFCLNFS